MLKKLAALALLAIAFVAPAQAQQFTRPITIIVGAAAGGPQDIIARVMAEAAEPRLKQKVVVENRPGQGGQLGLVLVNQAAPDGYTLGITASNIAALKFTGENFTLDAVNDFSQVIRIAAATRLLVASAMAPYKTLDEFLAFARANPGKVNFGDLGATNTLDMGLFAAMGNFKITHVPYAGSSAKAEAAAAAGEVDIVLDTFSGAKGFLEQGKTRLLAVGSPTRDPVAPNAPAIAEKVPGYQSSTAWYGLIGPPKIPPAVVSALYAAFKAALDEPATKQKIESFGLVIVGGDPAEMRKQTQVEYDLFADAVKRTGYKN